ncbi:MAG: hypothetical protein JKY55_07850 [Aliivibrio sp.]|uniref:hypothetical protein n=1 Tax=Aliivibrio sp. TaxID=1872443 RepID=UPI001A415E93|nr:hypothetical protein [Aliivibrio sp.]
MGEILYQQLIHGSATQRSLSKEASDPTNHNSDTQDVELEIKRHTESEPDISVKFDYFGTIFR